MLPRKTCFQGRRHDLSEVDAQLLPEATKEEQRSSILEAVAHVVSKVCWSDNHDNARLVERGRSALPEA